MREDFYFTKNVLGVAANNPLGVGVGNTQKHTENFNGLEVGAHNNFIMVMSDMGWIVFLGFFLTQLYILIKLFRFAIRSISKYGMSARMLFCSYLVLLVAGMYQDLLLYVPMWLIPALSTIVLFRESTLQPRRHPL